MCSRLVLAIQYGVVLFYARRNRRSRNNLALAVLLHLVPALIYMAATIASAAGSKAKVDHLWWAVALAELTALMVHAILSKTVSFSGTHLTERLNLLTLIVIGEGIVHHLSVQSFVCPSDEANPPLLLRRHHHPCQDNHQDCAVHISKGPHHELV